MNKMNTWAGALALGAVLLPALAHASQTYNTTMTFQSMNQSPWGSGPQQKATFDKFVGATWGPASGTAGGYTDITIPSVTVCDPFDGPGDDSSLGEGGLLDDDSKVPDCSTTPPVDLGQFGAVASASTQGSAGLHFYAYADAGSLNVTYSIQATINYPDNGVLYTRRQLHPLHQLRAGGNGPHLRPQPCYHERIAFRGRPSERRLRRELLRQHQRRSV